MKLTISTAILILFFALSAFTQIKKTDKETDGLKGPVKSVLSEIADLKKNSGKLVESARRKQEELTYDINGSRLNWKTYDYLTGSLFDSVIYSRIDGDKVSIYQDVNSPNKITSISSEPGNKPNKKSDTRYTNKFKYKYDSNGNMSEEAWYQNDGSLWLRYVYKIEGNKKEEFVYEKDGRLDQKYVCTLDDKGNEIERIFYDTDKNSVISKETYEYLDFDEQGNWTKKMTFEGDKESKFIVKPREVIYRKLIYF